MKRRGMILLALILCLGLFLVGCGRATSSENEKTKKSDQLNERDPEIESTFEYKLASMNAGHKVPITDPKITEFAEILDTMERKTRNTRKELADAIVKTSERLKDDDVSIGLLRLARELNDSMFGESQGLDINEISALYVALGVR